MVTGIFVEKLPGKEGVTQAAIEYDDESTVDVPLTLIPTLIAFHRELEEKQKSAATSSVKSSRRPARVTNPLPLSPVGATQGSEHSATDHKDIAVTPTRTRTERPANKTNVPPPPPIKASQCPELHSFTDRNGKAVALTHIRGVFKEALMQKAKANFGGEASSDVTWSSHKGVVWRGNKPLSASQDIPVRWETTVKYARVTLGASSKAPLFITRLNMGMGQQADLVAHEEHDTVIIACDDLDVWVTSGSDSKS